MTHSIFATLHRTMALALAGLFFVPLAVWAEIPSTPTPQQTRTTFRSNTSRTWVAGRKKKRRRRRRRRSLPESPININTATLRDLVRLPRIGRTKARRIMELRKSLGGRFQNIKQLLVVKGIGKGTLAKLRPYIKLGQGSSTAAPPEGPARTRRNYRKRRRSGRKRKKRRRRARRRRRKGKRHGKNCYERWQLKNGDTRLSINVNVASRRQLRSLPCIGKKRAMAIIAHRLAHGPFQKPRSLRKVSGIGKKTLGWLLPHITFKVNLNRASLREMEALKLLSGGLGEAIINYRKQRGPFRNLRQLLQVSGMGQATLSRLKPYVTLSGRWSRATRSTHKQRRRRRRSRRRRKRRARKKRRRRRKRRRRNRARRQADQQPPRRLPPKRVIVIE